MNVSMHTNPSMDLSAYPVVEQVRVSGEAVVGQIPVIDSEPHLASVSIDWASPLLPLPHVDGHRKLQVGLMETFTVLADRYQKNNSQTTQWVTELLDNVNRSSSKLKRLPSPEDFEIELSQALGKLKETQQKLDLEKMKQVSLQNRKKMEENHTKIKESTQAVKEAKNAGLASKIFGWLSGPVMMLAGLLLIATGVGAVAGVMLIASGALSTLNMGLQLAGEKGAISKEVMKTLGWVLLAIQVVVAVASIIVTFGLAFPAAVAKISQSSAQIIQSVTQVTTGLSRSTVHLIKLGTQVTTTGLNLSSGSAATANSVMQHRVLRKESEVKISSAELNQIQKHMEAMKEDFQQKMMALQHCALVNAKMMQAKGETLDRILRHPATV